MITLKATLVTASDTLRAELEPRTDFHWSPPAPPWRSLGMSPTRRWRCAMRSGRWPAGGWRCTRRSRPIPATSSASPAGPPPRWWPPLGSGPTCAAELLCAAGDNAGRIRSEAAYAKLCGACPIPASSGKTSRHRLNRGGNRQANAALFRIVVVRMRWHTCDHRLRPPPHR